MSADQIQKLMQGAIKAAQMGEKDLARRAFNQVVKLDPENEGAWLGLATVAPDTKQRLLALRQLLQINPENKNALEALSRLGIPPERLLGTTPKPELEPEPEPQASAFYDESQDEDYLGEFDDVLDVAEPPPSAPAFVDDAGFEDEVVDDDFLSADEDDFFDEFEEAMGEADTSIFEPELSGSDEEDFDALLAEEAELFAEEEDDFAEFEEDDDLAEFEDEFEAEEDFADFEDEEDDFTEFEADDPFAESSAPMAIEIPEEIPEIPMPPPAPPGDSAPLPDAALLSEISQQADQLAQAYLQAQLGQNSLGFEWKRKNRGRAGERDILVFRTQIAAAVTAGLIILAFIGVIAVLNVPSLRVAVLEPTETLTPTPTLTPTNTPGVTPTFSPEPEESPTASPTLSLSVTPGRIDVPPVPTEVYVPGGAPEDAQIVEAVQLMNAGRLDEAQELLEEIREATFNVGDARANYYLALIALERDDAGQALEYLNEGQEIWENGPNFNTRNFAPLLNAGFARVHLFQAEQLRAEGQNQQANNQFNEVRTRAETAVSLGADFVEGHLVLSDYYIAREDYQQALQVIDSALLNADVEGIFTDIALRTQKIRIFLLQERYDEALQEANEAITIDPYSELAHQLRIETVLHMDDPGLAVIYSEQYLFFYPGSAIGYKLLGDARVLEGKTDLALQAYQQALQVDTDDPIFAETLLARSELLIEQGRYSLALQDLDEFFNLRDDLEVRVLRMYAAYYSDDYETAAEDAEELLDADIIPDSEIYLIQTRIIVDQAEAGDTETYEEALAILNQGLGNLSEDLRPIANEYLARIHFNLGNFEAALNAVDQSLQGGDTGSRHYLRGLILEAESDAIEDDGAEQIELYQQARLEYEWVLSWSRTYRYPFREDAQDRYEDLFGRIEIIQTQLDAQ